MPHSPIDKIVATSLKASVALFPLMLGVAMAPAYAQGQPASSATAPKDAADADARESSDQDTKVIGAASDNDDKEKAVVVTGTSIRNAPPTGTNLISVDKEGIKATGANSAAELIASIPQAGGGFFNDLAQLGTFDSGGVSSSDASNGGVNKPDVRGIPLNTQLDTGSNTLLLLDGARMTGVGTSNSVSDPNTVPVALLERVEVNTDGGSSVYGSDAIGGVINFITRRRFDGVQVRGRYGIGDSYDNYEVGAIVGHDFGPANVYVSYSRTGNSGILNGERDYYKSIDWNTGLETNNQCYLPNVRIGSNFFGVDANGNISSTPSATAPNVCTPGKETSLTGSNKRNNVLGSFSYDFSEDVKFTIRGRYSDSKTHLKQNPLTRSLTVMPTDLASTLR